MSSIGILKIIENISYRRSGDIGITFHYTGDKATGISEYFDENTALVEKLTNDIPMHNSMMKKNAIINYLTNQGFRMITATSIPLLIDSNGEVGQARTEIYFEMSS